MKFKYLLPVLACVAITSCNQDEDMLSTNVQKGEFSPITFTVTKDGMDEAETKAWEDLTGSLPIYKFAIGDLLSLWNGMNGTEGVSGAAGSWTSIGQNAVFEGVGDSETGAFEFKTRSLVNKGTAILVYPADTAFMNKTQTELAISVSKDQNKDTKKFVPFVSDVMNIGEYDGVNAGDNTAGYGRNYNVALRQIGSVFQMKLATTKAIDFDALGVAPIEFRKVTIDNNGTNTFAETAKITITDTESNLATADPEKYAHFTKLAHISTNLTANAISTTDIVDNDKAYFTLLPITENNTTVDEASKIIVETSYGKVEITNDAAAANSDKGPLQNNAGLAGKNLQANLKGVLDGTWAPKAGSIFGDATKKGQIIRRTLTMDLSTLDMNNTVVTTSKQLIDLLKVYKALEIDGAITLVLDGEKESDANFVLTGAAIQALKDYSAGKVTLNVTSHSSDAIVLSEGATLEGLADANVKFNKDGITAILSEDATLDQSYDGSKTNGQGDAKIAKVISNATLTFTNAKASTTAASFELKVNGTIKFSGSKFTTGKLTTDENSQMIVADGQTVTFNGETKLYGEVDNTGIMSAAADVKNYGYINNKFEVSVLVGNASYKITNLGEIFNNGQYAVTYITDNGDITNTGRIILTKRNDNVSISSTTYQGYIVYTMNTAVDGIYSYSKGSSDVFNWLIIDTSSSSVGAEVMLNDNVKYLQIKGNAVNVTTASGGITVTDLFVNSSMRLLGNNELTATNVYVQDYILHAGGLTISGNGGNPATTYESNVYGETADETTYKNGQVRTVAGN